MSDIVERLRYDAARCEAMSSKGVSRNIDEAANEIERLRADLASIEKIANIPPADDRYGSLAVRMEKVWLLARGNSNEQSGSAP
jgi:hypothetical protein